MPPGLLEVGELGDLHAVQPDLPAQAPGPQGGGLPVILHEADVVVQGVEPDGLEAVQIELLDILGRGLHDHLVLVIVLQAVGVFAVAAVGGAPARLHVGHVPGLRPQGPEQGGGIEGAGPHLDIVGLPDEATLIRPEALQGHEQFLKSHPALLHDAKISK